MGEAPRTLRIERHEIQGFDMLEEGLIVRVVKLRHRCSVISVVLARRSLVRAPAHWWNDERCLHLSVWDDVEERVLTGPLTVVRGMDSPPPADCVCPQPRDRRALHLRGE